MSHLSGAPMKIRLQIEIGELVRLAVPLAAAQAGTQLMSLVDAAVVGRLGARQLGAVGVGNSLFFFLTIIAMGIVMGVDPMIAQAIGAGDPRRARQVMRQESGCRSLAVTVLISIPLRVWRRSFSSR